MVESSDTSISSVTDGEPPVWGAVARRGPVDTSSPAQAQQHQQHRQQQQQAKPVQASSQLRSQHGSISSGRPSPQSPVDEASTNGHLDALGGSAATLAAPVSTLRSGMTTRQQSDPVPLDERDQPDKPLCAMPTAVRTELHRCFASRFSTVLPRSLTLRLAPLLRFLNTHKRSCSGLHRTCSWSGFACSSTPPLSYRAASTLNPPRVHGPQAQEQRMTGLLQSLLVGACLGITPAIKWIPTAVLWGYFAYMALESLPGSQFWDRILLVFTDPRIRARCGSCPDQSGYGVRRG